jgi:hypothetical protein
MTPRELSFGSLRAPKDNDKCESIHTLIFVLEVFAKIVWQKSLVYFPVEAIRRCMWENILMKDE